MRRRSLLSAALGGALLVPLAACGEVRIQGNAVGGAKATPRSPAAVKAVNTAAQRIKAVTGVMVDYTWRTRGRDPDFRETAG